MPQYSDPELGRMPNVNQTGLNQAAAANKRMASPAKPGARNAAGMLPPSRPKSGAPLSGQRGKSMPMLNPKMGMALGKGVQAANIGHLGNIGAQGNAQSTRMIAPNTKNLPLKFGTNRGAAQAAGKGMGRAMKAFGKMKGRGKKIPI